MTFREEGAAMGSDAMERAIGRLGSVLECVRAEGYAAARKKGDAVWRPHVGEVIAAGVERGLASGTTSVGEGAARRVVRELGLVAVDAATLAAVRLARAKDGYAVAATLYDGGVSTEYGEACAELAEAVESALATPDLADLPALLAAAREHTMTPAEREEQSRSFAVGNVGMSNPSVTRAVVDAAAEAMASEAPLTGDLAGPAHAPTSSACDAVVMSAVAAERTACEAVCRAEAADPLTAGDGDDVGRFWQGAANYCANIIAARGRP